MFYAKVDVDPVIKSGVTGVHLLSLKIRIMKKVAINGLGRIGRAVLKIILERDDMEVVAVNDLVPVSNLVYLLKYDTVYGKYGHHVSENNGALKVGDASIKVMNEKDPSRLPWEKLNIDVVLECTGIFTKKDDLQKHVDAGAKKVILSAPAKSEGVNTVVYGVNTGQGDKEIISCASCTTNCITPVVEVMQRRIGIEKAILSMKK